MLARLDAFRRGLETLGWVEGRTVEIVARFDAIDADRNRAHVAELIAMEPDVIVSANPPSISALMKEAPAIPIVFPLMTDPIALVLRRASPALEVMSPGSPISARPLLQNG